MESNPGKKWKSVICGSENCKYGPYSKDIVKMGYDIVSVMEHDV